MGQPRFPHKQYETPNHPWQGDRIQEEKELKSKYGLKNKREIWKAQTRLREIRGQARTLVSRTRNPDDKQAALEAGRLVKRLKREGYVGEGATLNEVLGMDIERILNRRLQSQVYLKGIARTPKQARQFISHGLVQIGERRVTAPSYVVRLVEEEQIRLNPEKPIADEAHPVRPKAPGQELVEEAKEAEEAEATKDDADEAKAAEPAGEAKEAEATKKSEDKAADEAKEADPDEAKATEPAEEAKEAETTEEAKDDADEAKAAEPADEAKEAEATKKSEDKAAGEAKATEPAEEAKEAETTEEAKEDADEAKEAEATKESKGDADQAKATEATEETKEPSATEAEDKAAGEAKEADADEAESSDDKGGDA